MRSTPYPNYYEVYKANRALSEAERSRAWTEYRQLWERVSTEHIVTDFPVHLDIEVSNNCNLACPMCPRTLDIQQNGPWKIQDMSLVSFQRIIDEGVHYGLKAVNLNSYGESLLNRDLPKMVAYAKQSGIIDIMLHTNATILTERKSCALIEAGLDRLIVSFDAVSKDVYERIRVGADFEKTVHNVKRFVAIRNELGLSRPSVRIHMVRMKENEHEIDQGEVFWGDTVDLISYGEYRNTNAMDREDRYMVKRQPRPDFVCPQLWQRMVVSVSGVVTACCRDVSMLMRLGDVNKQPLREMWHGEPLATYRRMHLEGLAYKIRGCAGCDYVKGHQLYSDDF